MEHWPLYYTLKLITISSIYFFDERKGHKLYYKITYRIYRVEFISSFLTCAPSVKGIGRRSRGAINTKWQGGPFQPQVLPFERFPAVVKFLCLMYIEAPDRFLEQNSEQPATGKKGETHEISCDWWRRRRDERGKQG